ASPDDLVVSGDKLYFATTWGFATQEEAEYHHDIWVKPLTSARAKKLYKGLYGGSWGLVATKKYLYELNEGFASVERLAIDGSDTDGGKSIFHAITGSDSEPEVDVGAMD